MFPRHATDVISLVFGTIFAGFTVVWLFTVNGVIEEDQAWVGGPITLIAAGLVGEGQALGRQRPGGRAATPSVGRPGRPVIEPVEIRSVVSTSSTTEG